MKQLLIIKPSSMGDVVHAFPAVHSLLAANDGLAVDWVIHPAFAELLDYLPGIRRKILFLRRELGQLRSFFPTLRRLREEIRQVRYDAVIDLQGLFRSALIGKMARTDCFCGPAQTREKLARCWYDRELDFPPEVRHAIEKNCAMIRDFAHLENVSPTYHLPVVDSYAEAADRLLSENGLTGSPFIAVAPGARWKTKQWPPEFFGAWAAELAAQVPGRIFVLLGGPAEIPLGEAVIGSAPSLQMVNLCGRTSPGSLVEVIRRASLLICNDSGPMHLAAAAGTPVAAVFGPTDPDLTGPYGEKCRVTQPDLNCIKCMEKQCGTEACHRAVTPRQAADAALELLGKGAV